MKKSTTADLLKIGDLAKATHTNVSTIKFYVKEGLIQPACKTGPNMAYYSADCISRVQLIRSLQKEHYYPLSVIKRMLEHSDSPMEIKFLDVIHKVDYTSSSKTFSLTDAAKMSRLTKAQISFITQSGLIKPDTTGKRERYTDEDLQVMLLIRRRMDAGIPFAESVSSFLIYEKALRAATREEVDLFISQVLMAVTPCTKDAVRMICVSNETIDAFISVKCTELNREFGSERLSDLYRYSASLSVSLQEIGEALLESGYIHLGERCRTALSVCPEGEDEVSVALRYYHQMLNSLTGSLAKSIALSSRIHAYFLSLKPGEGQQGVEALLLYSLRLCWLCLAPALLNCSAEAQEAAQGFAAFAAKEWTDPGSDVYVRRIMDVITRTGGIV